MTRLAEYKESITQMTVNKKGSNTAPHKAILLLAIIDLIERGSIRDSFIPLSDELIRTFSNIWKAKVPITSPFSCKFSYPFFHLQSSPFWKLSKASTYIGQKEYSSIAALKRDFIGAKIDNDLFLYLTIPEFRDEIRQLLNDIFLTDTSASFSDKIGLLSLICILCTVA